MSSVRSPLPPFVDALPLPPRVLPREHGGQLSVPLRGATHRFHRDLPESRVFAFASSVADELPVAGAPLQAVAALVAYSRRACRRPLPDRRDRGVIGAALGPLTAAVLNRRRGRRA